MSGRHWLGAGNDEAYPVVAATLAGHTADVSSRLWHCKNVRKQSAGGTHACSCLVCDLKSASDQHPDVLEEESRGQLDSRGLHLLPTSHRSSAVLAPPPA
jgi:hypothetical protein